MIYPPENIDKYMKSSLILLFPAFIFKEREEYDKKK